jgi:hypothetical protein
MKPYGVDRRDRGCCPGHDKYPSDSYGSRRSKHARQKARRLAHKRARARERVLLFNVDQF